MFLDCEQRQQLAQPSTPHEKALSRVGRVGRVGKGQQREELLFEGREGREGRLGLPKGAFEAEVPFFKIRVGGSGGSVRTS